MRLTLSCLTASLLLSGCFGSVPTVESDLKVAAGSVWSSKGDATPSTVQAPTAEYWWMSFSDESLTSLISAAMKGSPTLLQANARIEQARSTAGIESAARVPSVGGTVSEVRTDGRLGRSTGVDFAWELDLTGRNAKASNAARYRYLATDSAYRHAQTRISAEVASLYFQYRFCQQSVALARESLESRKRTLDVVRLKTEVGAQAKSTLYQVEAGVAEAMNAIEAQNASCKRIHQQLVAVTALSSKEVGQLLGADAEGYLPSIEPVPFAAIPADVIRQRPDIQQLEELVMAASEEVGVAAAERLPSVSLFGSISWSSTDGPSSWSWGPSVKIPLFEGGKLKRFQERAAAQYTEALSAWKGGVLLAVQEVEDSLIRLNVVHKQVKTAEYALERYNAVYESSEVRFKHGAASLLELEDSLRSALDARQARLALRHEYTQARIALYKAAGGAWKTEQKQKDTAL